LHPIQSQVYAYGGSDKKPIDLVSVLGGSGQAKRLMLDVPYFLQTNACNINLLISEHTNVLLTLLFDKLWQKLYAVVRANWKAE
jgi:hypothetical protein